MKIPTLCAISIIGLSLFLKVQLEKDKVGVRHLPQNLKPLEASYEAESLKRYAFGFDSLLSSLLWVQVLQKASHAPVKSDEVSWEYAQIDALTTLDPRFSEGYAYGAIYLSVLRRDKLGGKLLLEKWANRYPTYWRPVHMLGMHHYEELGDYAAAAPYILRAGGMKNAPKWLSSLGLRLLSESGSFLNAITTAIEMSKVSKDPLALDYITQRIRALNFQIQKKEFEEKFNNPNLSKPRALASLDFNSQTDIPDSVREVLKEQFSFRWNTATKKPVALDPELEAKLGKVGIYVEPTAVKRVK